MIPLQLDPIVSNLPLSNESISAVASYERSIYIGTSNGELLHYYIFEDATEYLLIGQLPLKKHINKIICLKDLEQVFVLVADVLKAFSLPELTPISTNTELKDVQNICPNVDGNLNGIMSITSSSIQSITLSANCWSVSRTYDVSRAMLCTLPNKNGMILGADNEKYFIIKNGAMLPLFEYNSGDKFEPHLEQFYTSTGSEEYLFTILTDLNTSMAMFINWHGDVTRGTLTWVDHGYPDSVTVVWPYVYAVFQSTLVVSSLESLEHVKTARVKDNTQFQSLIDALVEEEEKEKEEQKKENKVTENKIIGENDSITKKKDEGKEVKLKSAEITSFHVQNNSTYYIDQPEQEIIGKTQSTTKQSNLIVFSNKNVYALHPVSSTLAIHEAFQSALITDEFEKVFNNTDESDYAVHVKLLASFLSDEKPVFDLLTKRRFDGKLVVDPNLTIKLLGGGDQYTYEVFPGLNNIVNEWDYSDAELMEKYLLALEPSDVSPEIRKLVYRICTEEEKIQTFLTKDKWTSLATDKEILNMLTEKKMFKSVSKIYAAIGKEAAKAYLEFLQQHISNELVDDGIDLLSRGVLEDQDYTNLVMVLLKQDKDKTYKFMRKSEKYLQLNKEILGGLASGQDEVDLAVLQVEILEKLWVKNQKSKLANELFHAVTKALVLLTQANPDRFSDLMLQYAKANDITENQWPKLLWIDYLSLQPNDQVLNLYIKSFELTIVESVNIPKDKVFEYHRMIRDNDTAALLNFGDFYAAEQLAAGGPRPVPRSCHYKDLVNTKELPTDISKLLLILKFYLGLYEEGISTEMAIQHFVQSYASKIPPLEIIQLLPRKMPVAYLSEYLKKCIDEVKMKAREQVLTKNLLKSNISQSRRIIKDLL